MAQKTENGQHLKSKTRKKSRLAAFTPQQIFNVNKHIFIVYQ